MGGIARLFADKIELAIEVNGSAPVERLDIFDGLDLIETVRPYSAEDLGARIRIVYQGAEYRGRARTTNWNGSLTLNDNAIMRAEMFNNWNLDRGLAVDDEQSASWKAVTTGNFGGFDLWLRDRQSGHLSIKTKHLEADLDIADIGYEARVFDAGGLDRSLKIYRLPEQLSRTHVIHRMPVKVNAEGDTRLFVRITQIDGHRAWSSPIYLFRKSIGPQ